MLTAAGGCSADRHGADGNPRRLRIAGNTAPNFADIPNLVAQRNLEARGYQIERTHYTQSELAAEALARGRADLAFGSFATYLAAAARGAPIVVVMEQARNVHLLVAAKPIVRCRDLSGKRVAVNSYGATGGTMVRAYVSDECPGTTPDLLVMPGQTNRLAALLAGQIEAATIIREDFYEMQKRAREQIGLVEDFARRWPDVAAYGMMVNSDFASANPQSIDDFIAECLSAHRTIGNDATRLAELAVTMLGATEDALPKAEAFVDVNTWKADGGLTPEVVRNTMKFLERAGSLPAGVDAARLIDRSFLDRALDRLGRRSPRAGASQ